MSHQNVSSAIRCLTTKLYNAVTVRWRVQKCLTIGAPTYAFGIHITVDITPTWLCTSKHNYTASLTEDFDKLRRRVSTLNSDYSGVWQIYAVHVRQLPGLQSASCPVSAVRSHMSESRCAHICCWPPPPPKCQVARMHNRLRLHRLYNSSDGPDQTSRMTSKAFAWPLGQLTAPSNTRSTAAEKTRVAAYRTGNIIQIRQVHQIYVTTRWLGLCDVLDWYAKIK